MLADRLSPVGLFAGVASLLLASLLLAQAAPERATLSDREIAARKAQLMRRLALELEPADEIEPEDVVQRRIDSIIKDAGDLANLARNSAPRFDCLSIQLRATNLRLTRWPEDGGNTRRLADLRAAARQIKTLPIEHALSIGDFWLTTAELFEIKNSRLSSADKQRQSELALRGFITLHNSGPAVDAARTTLRMLTDTAGPADRSPTETASAAANRAEASVDPLYSLGDEKIDEKGIRRVPVRCRYQRNENTLRVLTPDSPTAYSDTATFLVILPVEAGTDASFGEPLEEVRKLDLHNRYGVIAVYPTCSDKPWYADHPTDLKTRQASYITKVVVPAARELFAAKQSRVFLLGFGNSGWGAMSLMTRNPRDFDGAAAWDAPLMLDWPSHPGMDEYFPEQTHFERYALPAQVGASSRQLRKGKRIVLMGHAYYLDHMQRFDRLLTKLEIPHTYIEGAERRHRWDAGWLEEMFAKVLSDPIAVR